LPVRLFQNRRLALEAYRNMIAEEEEKSLAMRRSPDP
jgi:hypothetical protein